MLHGITTHAHLWDTFAEAAARYYRVIALDQRGHGDSQWATSYKTRDFVADLATLAQMLQIKPFTVIGLSMGAHNAMAYAAQHPGTVNKVVLVDLAPDFVMTPDLIRERTAAAHARFAALDEALALARAGNSIAPDHELWLRTSYGLRSLTDSTLSFKYDPVVASKWEPDDLWKEIGKIRAPVLIIRGSESKIFSRDEGRRMERVIPSATYVEVAGAGHTVPNDRPELFFDTVRPFLADEAQ